MFLSFLVPALLSVSAVPDSLQAARVVVDRGLVVSRTDTLILYSQADAGSLLHRIPALYVGDYGSAAGLKTASLRGLGSAHSAIYLDGVRVGNLQSGQADLGFLDLQDLSRVVVDYAQNSLSFQSGEPVFRNAPFSGRVRLDAGSFGSWQPYGKLAVRLGGRWSLSAHAGCHITHGRFPLADESLRANNDFRQLKTGADLFGRIKGGVLHAKLYYHGADRGTPGSLAWPSNDRQQDRNLGFQAVLKKTFSPLYTLHLSGKFAHDRLLYKSEWGDSEYLQTEWQLNSAHKFRIKPWWDVSLAADASWDALPLVYDKHRLSTLVAASMAFHTKRVKASLALEHAALFDRGGVSRDWLSPSADLRVTLLEGLDVVAFGRRSYRAPTFNELYFPGYGNVDLKPEDVWMADLGADFSRRRGGWRIQARVDGYYNHLTNKIISAPVPEDASVWLPYNVGRVQALGADVLSGVSYSSGAWTADGRVHYGWQRALDKTPGTYSFGQPIPYVAAHTLVLTADVSWKGWTFGAVWNLRSGRRDAAGQMPDWHTLDIRSGKRFSLGKGGQLELHISGRNLGNFRYETVSGYPMPGSSVVGGLEYRF